MAEDAPEGLVLAREGGAVVANKPAGLASTGRTLDDRDCLQWALQEALRRKRVWAVHQLDRDTSGLNLFTTNRSAVERWSERLRDGVKLYLALCHGALPEAPFEIDLPIGQAPLPGGRSKPAVAAGGKPARSTVLPVASSRTPEGEFGLAVVRIHTGRTHQVRVHLAHAGHPLVGERVHREPPCTLHPRHALHAWRLDLPARGGDRRLAYEAPIPEDLRGLALRLSLDLTLLEGLEGLEPGRGFAG